MYLKLSPSVKMKVHSALKSELTLFQNLLEDAQISPNIH